MAKFLKGAYSTPRSKEGTRGEPPKTLIRMVPKKETLPSLREEKRGYTSMVAAEEKDQ